MPSRSSGSGSGSPASTRRGTTPAQVSLAWLLRRAPNMLPIPGTTSEVHLAENLRAADLKLTDEQYDRVQSVAGG